MAQLLKTNGAIETVRPMGKYFTLKEIQSYVAGYFECSRCPCFGGDKRVMLMNEDGLALKLPANPAATELYRNTHIIGGMQGDGTIVGNVLVCETMDGPDGEEYI